jgi:hypothetical protein
MVHDCENIIEMDWRKINCIWWKRVRCLSISIFMKNKSITIVYCAYLNSISKERGMQTRERCTTTEYINFQICS